MTIADESLTKQMCTITQNELWDIWDNYNCQALVPSPVPLDPIPSTKKLQIQKSNWEWGDKIDSGSNKIDSGSYKIDSGSYKIDSGSTLLLLL